MKIQWIVGNRLELAIPLQKMTVTPEGKVTEDYVVPDDAKVRVILKSVWKSYEYSPSEIVDGNKVVVRDNGTLPVGVYAVHVYVREADGGEFKFRPLHSGYSSVITIRPDNTGVTEEYTDFVAGSVLLDAQTYIFAKGDKGDPGAPGIGVPAGGSTGQVLAKKSDNNYDTEWVDQQGGGDSSQADWAQNDQSAPDYIKNKPSVYTQQQTDEAIKQAKKDVSWEANEYYVLGTGNSATGMVRNPKGRVVYYSSARTAFIRILSLPHYTSTGISFKVTGTPIEDTDNFVRIAVSGNEIIFRTSNRPTIFKAGVTYEVEYTYITHDNLSCVYLESWSGGTSTAAYTGSYNDLSDKPNIPVVPTNVSAFNNDAGYITKSVNDLVNYYLKSEVYTKAEVANLIAAIQQFHYEIYASTSAVTSPAGNVLYLIGPTGTGSDRYEEYVYDSTKQEPWVKIGDTSIDLSGYYTSQQTDSAITQALNTALANYTTTNALKLLLAGKQDVINDLATIRSGAAAGATAYQKPVNGIPQNDFSESVQVSLNKADTALQQHQDISGKEDVTTIVAPVDATDATQPITTLSCQLGKYYRIDLPVETLAVTLPAMENITTIKTVVLYLTGGTTPAVTILSTAPTGGIAPDVHFSKGYAIESGKTYEVNCLWNGLAWIVASVEISLT